MIRLFAIALLFATFMAPTQAQTDADKGSAALATPATPIVRTDLQANQIITGQPVILRLTVLAPTFLPAPPVFPSMEVPNLMVRLPERASGPTSERIGSETWSGVTRAYRLYPMIPGSFRIDPQPLRVTYADPQTNQPISIDLSTDGVTFAAVIPDGAEALDPFLAAEGLSLEQTLEGEPLSLATGEAVVRTVTARIKGASPLFLPTLIPPLNAEGLAEYRKDPVLNETMDRGALSGTRTETVTYVAEAGGTFSAPPVSLEWFNLGSKTIAAADVEGFDIVASGPPPRAVSEADQARLLIIVLAGLGLLIIGFAIWRWLLPPALAWRANRHAAWLASEARAYKLARGALSNRDLSGATRAIDVWEQRILAEHQHTVRKADKAALAGALAALGAAQYGRTQGTGNASEWKAAEGLLTKIRQGELREVRARRRGVSLPPLNPKLPA